MYTVQKYISVIVIILSLMQYNESIAQIDTVKAKLDAEEAKLKSKENKIKMSIQHMKHKTTRSSKRSSHLR